MRPPLVLNEAFSGKQHGKARCATSTPINQAFLEPDQGAATDLHSVFDLAGVVPDDKRWLHNSRELDVTVSLMLPLELVQEGLVRSLWETKGGTNK